MPRSLHRAALWLALSLAPAMVSAEESYTVKRGDSFSSIAAHTLGNASRWREIWALNPEVRTPSALQPGTQLRLPAAGSAVAAAPPAPSADTEPAPHRLLPDPIQALAADLINSGHIERLRRDYRLLDATDTHTVPIHAMRQEAEGIYLDVNGLSANAAPAYGLFKASPEPARPDVIELTRIGQANSLMQQTGQMRLQVSEYRESLNSGSGQLQLLPLARSHNVIASDYPPRPVQGRILKALYEQPGGYLLLLDQGSRAGLVPGHLLRYGKTADNRNSAGGWLLVIDTLDTTSLALVLQARQVPAVGDPIY